MPKEIFDKINVEDLHFDYKNPRLIEFGIDDSISEDDLVTILWDAMDVKELAMSIIASGYFENDPLIVADENNRNIVIEGNRRLAAVKILNNREKYKSFLENIPSLEDYKKIESLPVMFSSRKDSWQFLGFKHVNGPAKWGSYAKAKYISDIHNNFRVPLKEIGKQIGDTHNTVRKLYHGLMVIEQAEREKVFNRNDTARKSFAFSHLYVGIQREGIKNFLEISPASEEKLDPVPKENIKNLGELLLWLYGSKRDEIEPIIQTQNPHLRQLDLILQNREATIALRNNETLEYALEITKPKASVFEEELLIAKSSLIKARGLLTEGYDGSEALLRIALSIADIADDLQSEMERKHNLKKTRLSQEN